MAAEFVRPDPYTVLADMGVDLARLAERPDVEAFVIRVLTGEQTIPESPDPDPGPGLLDRVRELVAPYVRLDMA